MLTGSLMAVGGWGCSCVGTMGATLANESEDATLAEALGLREAQWMVTRLKLNKLVIEMDAKKVVDTIMQKS
jgi:hypothetical protein